MRGRQAEPAPPAAPPAAAPPAPVPKPRAKPVPAVLVIGAAPAGLDAASWERFRAGKVAPARSLDLHGRTAQQAHHALVEFLHSAARDRLRCVEIITGRGSGEAGGVLRRELPLWLNLANVRPLLLAAVHPHAANSGAVRVLLRRPR